MKVWTSEADAPTEVTPLARETLRDASAIVVALIAAFLIVTSIGCTNLAHLLMARAVSRRRDVAIRLALGARRMDLVRLTGLELGILLVAGSAFGIAVAYTGLAALPAVLPAGLYIPRADALLSDPAVLLATAGAWTAIGLVLTAAMWTLLRREDSLLTLKGGGRAFTERGGGVRRSGRVLLVCEVALAFALTAGAFSMLQHVRTLLNEDARMDPARLLVLDVFFDTDAMTPAIPALEAFLPAVATVRDVKEVALVEGFPQRPFLGDVMAPGVDGPIARTWQPSELHVVTPGYSSIVGLQVIDGRWLGRADARTARPVVVINETMARHYFRSEPPVGKRLRNTRRDLGAEWDIVGVVREPKRLGSRADPTPAVYLPWAQVPLANMSVLVRTGGDARKVAAVVRNEALRMVPGAVEVRRIQTGAEIVSGAAARSRFVGAQLMGLAALALLLASTGIYSIVSFRTSRRMHEIAVRMVVGSTRTRVVALVVGETMTLVGLGIAVGLPLSIALERLLDAVREGGGPAQGIAYVTTVVVFSAPAASRRTSGSTVGQSTAVPNRVSAVTQPGIVRINAVTLHGAHSTGTGTSHSLSPAGTSWLPRYSTTPDRNCPPS